MPIDGTVLWTDSDGIRCLLVPYDEARFQLKLVRPHGTVRADLFASYAEALAASDKWRQQFNRTALQASHS